MPELVAAFVSFAGVRAGRLATPTAIARRRDRMAGQAHLELCPHSVRATLARFTRPEPGATRQLKQHHMLTDELERLRAPLVRLEGHARSRVNSAQRNRKPAPTRSAPRERAAKPASAPGRAPRGQNKAKVLDALRLDP